MKIKTNTSWIITNFEIQILIMRVLQDICFSKFIINVFQITNYRYAFKSEYNLLEYILSWVVLLLSVRFAKEWYHAESPSKTTLLFIYYIQFVPFTTMMGFSCFSISFNFYSVLYWIFIFLFSSFILLSKSEKNDERHEIKERTLAFEIVITILSGIAVLYFGYMNNFRIDLNIFNAYTYRDEAKSSFTNPFSAYLLGLSRILIPTGIVYSIRRKKTWMIVVFILFSVFDYSFDGSKTLYFISIVAILVALFYKQEFVFSSNSYVYLLINRRLFFVPNLINYSFFDFMKTHSANLFSNLLRFIGINSSFDIAYVIGEEYFHSSGMSANTGTIGDAIWQFKYLGFLIMPFLIVFLLRALDYSTRHISNEMIIIPCLIFAYYLNNSSFTTACFNHGLVLFCLIMILYKSRITKNTLVTNVYD